MNNDKKYYIFLKEETNLLLFNVQSKLFNNKKIIQYSNSKANNQKITNCIKCN